MRFRQLRLHVHTTDGPYQAELRFNDGLVVIWADNSMGKSTCVKAILIALGMEATLTTSQSDLPLPPAVKSRLESTNGEYEVLESEVFLEIENSKKKRIVVQRTIKGQRDKNLITVHEGPALSQPNSSFNANDYFVNRAGAAMRESGFHHYLANFLEWELPLVQTYDGNQYPLYLQCIVPYFSVEQTRGWSTVQPPLPTHFRIRDPHKRAVEFLLALDAHRNALQRQELEFETAKVMAAWSAQYALAADLANRVGSQLFTLPKEPKTAWPPVLSPGLAVSVGEEWITIDQRLSQKTVELAQLVEKEIPRVEEVAASAKHELASAEDRLRDRQALLARLLDALAMEEQETKRVENRLVAIKEDIQRNKDIRVLRQLGSQKESMLRDGHCPVCHQSIQDSLAPLEANQTVMSLDESIEFLAEQLRTYDTVHANAKRVVEGRALQIRAMREELSALRDDIRSLRQTLVSDGRGPSVAAIQARLRIEGEIQRDQTAIETFMKIVNGFEPLAEKFALLQTAAALLPRDDISEADKLKLRSWAKSLKEQLVEFGFASFPVDHVIISQDTYRPEHEGFNLESSFSLQNSVSASDLIRTIWAYLGGMLEVSRTEKTNHPGCLIFDEPRQQSARDISFGALLKRASFATDFGQQVIFFTSENKERLKSHLQNLPHSLIEIDGRILKRIL